MHFASVRIITADAKRLVAFYERVTSITATWFTPDFAEVSTSTFTLAIANESTLALFGRDIAKPASNRSVILELRVDDCDRDFARIEPTDLVQAPTTMPWGNRSLLFRDPDGTLVNLFTPVTPEARKKFGLG
ncbi:MAG: VOC family protein [Deltaproteobacteria bacterium]|nr:VOC family protein [Nannocystaceae bacterium]